MHIHIPHLRLKAFQPNSLLSFLAMAKFKSVRKFQQFVFASSWGRAARAPAYISCLRLETLFLPKINYVCDADAMPCHGAAERVGMKRRKTYHWIGFWCFVPIRQDAKRSGFATFFIRNPCLKRRNERGRFAYRFRSSLCKRIAIIPLHCSFSSPLPPLLPHSPFCLPTRLELTV